MRKLIIAGAMLAAACMPAMAASQAPELADLGLRCSQSPDRHAKGERR